MYYYSNIVENQKFGKCIVCDKILIADEALLKIIILKNYYSNLLLVMVFNCDMNEGVYWRAR